MRMSFRHFGAKDSIPLSYIAQIPNMGYIVSAIYDVQPGEVWPLEALQAYRDECAKAGLKFEVVESIPVHEDIKLGKPNRDVLIERYAENIRRCAKVGVRCVCYNFMPVFDWLRTDLMRKNPDGSTCLSYDAEEFAELDKTNLHLPGWDESYSSEGLKSLLKEYEGMGHETLFGNLVYFLNKLVPVLEETGVNMAIHPDDPPWDVFGLPRVVSTEEDFDRLFQAVPSKRNGVTFCVGSLGESGKNDVYRMCEKYTKDGRMHFVHLRNIKREDEKGSFHESGHLSKDGSLDMGRIVRILVRNGFDGYVRPDHGRNIWGESGKPGYGLYDRALGVAYINGLFEMAEGENE